MEFKEMSIDAQKAFSGLCLSLMAGTNSNRLLEMSALFADCLIECMASDKGITDYRDYSDLAVTISHSIENSIRDYVEYHIDKEYGPDEEKQTEIDSVEYMNRKINLSSLYGMTVKDAENAD